LITFGLILLLISFIAKIPAVWTIGIIAAVIGAVLALFGMAGQAAGARRTTVRQLPARGRIGWTGAR